ncbi:Gfo/Idh/MocA family oxidoreductase [Microlunatus speluncae]|uniref:Gfo/Idh/MocA family oxidoreductase n=1 Tax=Microlunatus speluncae TaxID=2594267 RepID=UPI00126656AB|nr:Gfo/Idh/MocA family oxidoreductase [Microlunatus speluncae]
MRTLGFVDHHLANYHADVFLRLLRTSFADRGVEVIGYESDPVPGGDWCDRNQVRRADSIDALVDEADAILILAPDDIDTHPEFARAVIRGAKPVVLDKLLATNLADARAIAELARGHGAPVLSSSALRYAVELADLLPAGPPIEAGFARGFGDWDRYGIHTLAVATRIGGFGVRRVIETGTVADRCLTLDYGDHRVTVDCHAGDNAAAALGWSGGFRVAGQWSTTKIIDHEGFYRRTLGAYLDFCAGATPDQSLDQAVELVALHAASDQSLAADGAWIEIASIVP